MPELTQQTTAKLVLLGEMGSGKSSLVLRYVKGQFFDYQVNVLLSDTYQCNVADTAGPRWNVAHACLYHAFVQASTVGAAFLTKTIPELSVKFEIW